MNTKTLKTPITRSQVIAVLTLVFALATAVGTFLHVLSAQQAGSICVALTTVATVCRSLLYDLGAPPAVPTGPAAGNAQGGPTLSADLAALLAAFGALARAQAPPPVTPAAEDVNKTTIIQTPSPDGTEGD